jgi:GAF domain-containing protein
MSEVLSTQRRWSGWGRRRACRASGLILEVVDAPGRVVAVSALQPVPDITTIAGDDRLRCFGVAEVWQRCGRKVHEMQIDAAALTASIGELYGLDLERGLTPTLQQVVMAAKSLFHVDGAGLMLADPDGALRWASASEQQSQLVEEDQERLARGPCMAAFVQRATMSVRNANSEPDIEPDIEGSRSVLVGAGIQAALSVPVELQGGPIGTLDLYSATPRDWDDSEVSALQAYAGIVANLLGSAAEAQVKGRLADQLQAALAHRALIEQAKGVLMEREHLDPAAAFERLRALARPSSRKVADVAREVLADVPPVSARP